MKKYVLILLCVFFVLGCSESDFDDPNNRGIEYNIKITGDSVILSTGSVSKIGFIVSPTTSDLHLSNDLGNISIVLRLQKTVDIHPPKTGISVHFSDSFILMALQI